MDNEQEKRVYPLWDMGYAPPEIVPGEVIYLGTDHGKDGTARVLMQVDSETQRITIIRSEFVAR